MKKQIIYYIVDNGIDGKEKDNIIYAAWSEDEIKEILEKDPAKAWRTLKESVIDVEKASQRAFTKLDGIDKLVLGLTKSSVSKIESEASLNINKINILIESLQNSKKEIEKMVYDDKIFKLKKRYCKTIRELHHQGYFDKRTFNCLTKNKIETLYDLLHFHRRDLLRIRHFGKNSLSQIEKYYELENLRFGLIKI